MCFPCCRGRTLPPSAHIPRRRRQGGRLTDAIRQELAPRGIHVAALHVGFMDTDMAGFVPADRKIDPSVVAKLALDGLFAGEPEILADDLSRTVKAQLSAAPERPAPAE